MSLAGVIPVHAQVLATGQPNPTDELKIETPLIYEGIAMPLRRDPLFKYPLLCMIEHFFVNLK